MAEPIEHRIAGIIAATGRIDPALLTPDAALTDLGLDSVTLVETFFAIEEAFDITLPFDLGPEVLTFAYLCRLVSGRIAVRA